MRLSHQIEQYLFEHPRTTVSAIADWLGVSEWRCLDELSGLEPFGVQVDEDGFVAIDERSASGADTMASCGASI